MNHSIGTTWLCGVILSCFLIGCAATKNQSSPAKTQNPIKSTSQIETNQGTYPLVFCCTNSQKAESQKSKSWVDVADTAVTMGLSALIGGGIGILTAWLSFRREAETEYLKRKRYMLEGILEKFDQFAEAQSLYWTDLINGVYKRDKKNPDDPLTKKDLAELKKGEQKLLESYLVLIRCRSKLSLVGEKTAVKVLNEVKEISDDFFKTANIDNLRCTEAFLNQAKEKMSAVRNKFYDALHEAYARKSD
jgi:hypothetical protein